ncbi:uncharacterized protein [Primulina huaijiensis]|uniref:uncharacterized protein n=1 Tax=Primulina huaijiensis TaxID=1492673 RepID=UPI003CC79732
MGLLHNQLSDSDSILIFAVIVIAKSLRYLHSIVSTMMRTIGLLSPHFDRPDDHHHQVYDVVGSGLANLILLCEQLSMNRESSFPVQPDDVDSDCVVCLNRLGDEGDYVRKLACGHMFHKDCFAGWLDQLNFNCPICRQPLAQDDRLDCTQRRLAAFRGLRVLLIDNNTETLLNTALILEGYSYKVTTTELASVALSIVQERKDRFDLIMADFDMSEMDGIKFVESVQLIKDFPMLLMCSELKKEVVKEAMAKGACYFIRKPISPGKLRNVWQHVYKRRRHEIENTKDDQENVTESKKMMEYKGVDTVKGYAVGEQENEQLEFNDQIKNNLDKLVNAKEGTKLSEICIKKSLSAENDESELKRKRTRMASDDFEQENSRNMKPSGGIGKKVKGEERTGENIASLSSTTNLPLKFNEYISSIGEKEMWPEAEGIQGVMVVPNSEELSNKFKGRLNSSYLAQELPVPAISEDAESYFTKIRDSGHFLTTFKSSLQEANIGKEENQFQRIDNATVELGEVNKATNVQPTSSDIGDGSE